MRSEKVREERLGPRGRKKRKKEWTRRRSAMEKKKKRKMRIHCMRRATCRTDT